MKPYLVGSTFETYGCPVKSFALDQNRQSTDAISYAQFADSKSGQSSIKLLETITGRLALITRAHGYQDEVA